MGITKYYIKDNEVKEFRVEREEYPENPRDWGDNLCELYIEWGRHNERYGDNFHNKTLSEIIWSFAERYLDIEEDDYYKANNELIIMLQSKASDEVKVFPIFGYEHSGFTVSMGNDYPYNDRWDGGLAGWIFVTKEKCDEYGADFNNAKELAEIEVKTFDMFLNGNVYGYIDEGGDSCWGFYSENYGEELFNEIAIEAGHKDTKFYKENEVEIIITKEVRIRKEINND